MQQRTDYSNATSLATQASNATKNQTTMNNNKKRNSQEGDQPRESEKKLREDLEAAEAEEAKNEDERRLKEEEKCKRLEQETREIQRENERLEQEIQREIERLERLEREKRNRCLLQLLELGPGKLMLRCAGETDSHVKGSSTTTGETISNFNLLPPDIDSLKKQDEGGDTGKDALPPSSLMQEFVDQTKVKADLVFKPQRGYDTEADLCRVVESALSDAISIIEVLRKQQQEPYQKLRVSFERRLFSCRPDIMVVRDERKNNLLCIEVKKPVKDLATYPMVLDQVYNQSQASDVLGVGTMLVVLTSFNETYLCSSDEFDFDFDTKPSSTPSSDKEEQQVTNNCAASSSPSSAMEKEDSADPSYAEFKAEEPNEQKVYHTRKFAPHEIVKLLYTAILRASEKYEATTKTIYRLDDNEVYKFPKVLQAKAGSDGYSWGALSYKLGQPIVSTTDRAASNRSGGVSSSQSCYYIIRRLAHGYTSNVFHALDEQGKQVAIKMYVKNLDTHNNVMAQKDFDNRAKEKTEEEKNNLLAFYGFLAGEVKTVKLFGKYWCVVMPVFELIPRAERGSVLTKIKEVLENTFQQNCKKYREQDISWRHVGRYKKGNDEHCILFDLEDLEEVGNDEAFADKHYSIFKSSASGH